MTAITTLADIVRVHGVERPDKPMITFEGRTRTFGDVDRRSSQVAQALLAAGVRPHDRVAFLDKNVPEYFEFAFGAAKLNAVTVAVNWRLAPREMAQVLNDATAKVLLVGAEFVGHVEKIAAELETVTRIVHLDEFEDWIKKHPADDPGITATVDDVAFQLYTSGTTGLPKGVMLSNENVFALLPGASESWGFRDDMVSLGVMPLFHISGSGWNVAVMFFGGHVLLLRDVDPAAILRNIAEHHVTHALFVPAVIQLLLATPGIDAADLSSLQMILYGASPITETILTKAMATFQCDFMQAYGLTETTGAVTQLDAADHRSELLRSCGKPLPGVELRVVDQATGDDVPDGTVGEVWIRSRQNMLGYWRKPDETAATKTPDNWIKTGDAGYLQDGFLFLYDRVKDMVVSGGENVYPAEVENVLMQHPDVADVAVIGVPHDKWGETVKAVVVARPGTEPTEAALISFTRDQLAHYKCPTSVDFVDVLPRNPSGKLLKRELREPYWADRDRRIGG